MMQAISRKLSTRRGQAGYTLAELVMVAAVMTILAGAALPAVKFTSRRTKEMELRHHLRSMRDAIDTYKRYSDLGMIERDLTAEGFPTELEDLLEVEIVGTIDKKIKLLRLIRVDPMTGVAEWGLRSRADEPDSDSWGGENIFDVYSLSNGVGLNGVPYREW